jgi:hypothetical protein
MELISSLVVEVVGRYSYLYVSLGPSPKVRKKSEYTIYPVRLQPKVDTIKD